MSARDRLVLMGMAAVAVLAAVWMLAVSPARKQASTAGDELASARTQLVQAQSEAAEARNAQQRYRGAYASLASLGQAVPVSQEVPTLMYELDKAADRRRVEFTSIANGGAASGSSSTSSGTPTTSGPAAAVSPFTQMPFTFVFTGGYQDLIRLLTHLEAFTVQTSGGSLRVSGRLLTIQSITLGTSSGSGAPVAPSSSTAKKDEMSWTIQASAYVLAPASPAAGQASAPSGTQPAGSTAASGSSSIATPAVVRANG